MRKLALFAVLVPLAAAAAPGVTVAPLKSSGEHVRFPRVTGLADAAIQSRVNAILAKAEAQAASDQRDCLQQVKDQHLDQSDYEWNTAIAVTYVSRRYLSLTNNTSYDCAGAHPDASQVPLTIDLRSGTAVDWTKLFVPGFLSTADKKGRLAALYLARYIARNGKNDPDDCVGTLRDDGFLDPALWLDGKAGGFMVSPQLAHVVAACGDDIAIPPGQLAPYLTDKTLAEDLRATTGARN